MELRHHYDITAILNDIFMAKMSNFINVHASAIKRNQQKVHLNEFSFQHFHYIYDVIMTL